MFTKEGGRKLKKFLIGLGCCFIMIFSVCYASDVQVQVNGDFLNFADSNGNVVNPQIINSRTMVPFRKIFNSLGVADEDITWVSETRTVIAKKDNIFFMQGSRFFIIVK